MPLASWLTTVIALSIPLSSTAFDFDDEDLSVPVSSSPSHAGDDDVAELTSVVLSHAIGDVDLAPRNKLFFKPPKGAETVGGSVAIRVGQGRLDSTALEALKAVAKQGGVYTIALPSVLSDPNSPPVIASASACAILASRFEERLQLTMTSRDRVADILEQFADASFGDRFTQRGDFDFGGHNVWLLRPYGISCSRCGPWAYHRHSVRARC